MKQEKWLIAAKKADFAEIGRRFSIDPVVARLIRNRDIAGTDAIEKYLHGTTDDLYDPLLLKGAAQAVSVLQEKIRDEVTAQFLTPVTNTDLL